MCARAAKGVVVASVCESEICFGFVRGMVSKLGTFVATIDCSADGEPVNLLLHGRSLLLDSPWQQLFLALNGGRVRVYLGFENH